LLLIKQKAFLLDTRFLRSLIAVVDGGSIAEAARAEGLTAAAVSQRIQALERSLGIELLSRVGHSAAPTAACRSLLPRARRIVQEAGQLAGDVDPSGLTGPLRIGSISTSLTGLVTGALRALVSACPNVRPVVVPGTSRALYRDLLAGNLDAAILAAPPFALPKGLRETVLRREPLALLSRRRPKDGVLAALRSCPYIRYDPGSWGGRHGEEFLIAHGLSPVLLCDLDGLEAIATLVSEDAGVSLVPAWHGLANLARRCTITPVGDTAYDRIVSLLTRVECDRPQMLQALGLALTGICPPTSSSTRRDRGRA
jgi:DNA-binding transcriptional LysR family regulator